MSTLSVIATPIGNLEDISLRAIRFLKQADFILCEDTRQTKRLLDHYQVITPTLSYHQHSNLAKENKILDLLKQGKNLALVSDAGTPGLSDPGARLVSLVREKLGQKVDIITIPGPSALTSSLAIAGLGFDHFLFLGFLPHKKGRQSLLKQIAQTKYSVILYESKHRILKLLQELANLEKDNKINFKISLARELTKIHESFYQNSALKLIDLLTKDSNNLRGEFVVLIQKI